MYLHPRRRYVALRKESVDRNHFGVSALQSITKSLSARRAWIEIFLSVLALGIPTVALRKESVDRNLLGLFDRASGAGRSPQGERG